jgi:hypothetical protein
VKFSSSKPADSVTMLAAGEVAEWSNVPDSKSGVGASLPWVRIPPSPPWNNWKAAARKGLRLFHFNPTLFQTLPQLLTFLVAPGQGFAPCG